MGVAVMKFTRALIVLLPGLGFTAPCYPGPQADRQERPAQDQQHPPQPSAEGQRRGGSKAGGLDSPPAEFLTLADNARSIPAEFAADALIKIAQSNRVKDR